MMKDALIPEFFYFIFFTFAQTQSCRYEIWILDSWILTAACQSLETQRKTEGWNMFFNIWKQFLQQIPEKRICRCLDKMWFEVLFYLTNAIDFCMLKLYYFDLSCYTCHFSITPLSSLPFSSHFLFYNLLFSPLLIHCSFPRSFIHQSILLPSVWCVFISVSRCETCWDIYIPAARFLSCLLLHKWAR